MPSQGSNASTSSATAGAPAEDGAGARATTPAETSGASKPPSKDEVGWYFVESYYTTLSKNPETLHVSRHFNVVPEDTACTIAVKLIRS